jgi:hypothetical protein
VFGFFAGTARFWISTLRQIEKLVNAALITPAAFVGRELSS